nr:dolichyl-phosphate beta-glucosyltransferase-like [Nerophis lumbriciformis]
MSESTQDSTPALSVVIPAYNEEHRLGPSLERILSYLESLEQPFEVLVADDGSRDGTSRVADSYSKRGVQALRHQPNRGKGAALKLGVAASRGQRVLLSDADLSTPIEDLERLQAACGEAELVFGSRAVAGARLTQRQPFYRELMGKTFNKIVQLSGVRGIRDTQCGFKLLDGNVARKLFAELVTPGFAYDVELVWLARQRGYRVCEVGVTWANSPETRVRPWLDPLLMLAEIARFRWHHRGLQTAGTGELTTEESRS